MKTISKVANSKTASNILKVAKPVANVLNVGSSAVKAYQDIKNNKTVTNADMLKSSSTVVKAVGNV